MIVRERGAGVSMFPQAGCITPFFFNDTATTEIYTLSLHDALPIFGELRHQHLLRPVRGPGRGGVPVERVGGVLHQHGDGEDRKSTRLNSSHQIISYAVFCLKKKKTATEASAGSVLQMPASHHDDIH